MRDRDAIFDYIQRESPQAAIDIDDRICIAVEHLANFPQMGRSGRVPGTRELVITRTPYIAVYQITGETIRIERVLHGAQQLPS